jgi:glycosyltransferase involved in cell wall biosynthesis
MFGRRFFILDLRSLQDPASRGTAAGRVAANLARTARRHLTESNQIDLLGLVDREMPDLDRDIREQFDGLQGHGYQPVPRPAVFVQFDPIAGDPLMIGRILNSREVFKATIVPDQGRWCGSPKLADRIESRNRLGWLARYDHFYPVTSHAADWIGRVLGVGLDRVTPTAIPVQRTAPASTGSNRDSMPGPVLVAGGGASRQHLDSAVRAHATSITGRGPTQSLLIIGNHPPSWQSWLRQLHIDSGGVPGQLRFLDAESGELPLAYRDAACLIVLSGGKRLPTTEFEAVAAGVPIIDCTVAAGDGSAGLRGPRCDPGDHELLAKLIDRVATDLEFRRRLLRQQAPGSEGVLADGIARAFWQDLKGRAANRPQAPMIGGKLPTIALLSPLPPERSPATDYSAALIAELGKTSDLHVFTDTPSPTLPSGVSSTSPLSAFPLLSRRFDRVVTVMETTLPHRRIFELLMRYGGACIQYDLPSPRAYLQWVGEQRGRQIAESELKRPLAQGELERWLADETTAEATFLGEMASQSAPLCVHSRTIAKLVQDRFNIVAPYLPLARLQRWDDGPRTPAPREAARARLGIASGEIAVVAFGTLAAPTAPEDSIWAMSMLRDWSLPAALYFVGEPAIDTAGLVALSNSLGLADRIHFVTAAPLGQRTQEFLLAADLAVQLRGGSLGMPSAPLLDCVTAGLPTIVTAATRDSIDAPSYVSAIRNEISPVLIAEAIANELAREAAIPQREAERDNFRARHSLPAYVAQLMAALSLDPSPRCP